MIVAIAFALALAVLTFRHWERASLAAAESNIGSTDHRYCYTSTTSRRVLVATGFFILVMIVVGLPAYGLTQLVWTIPGTLQAFSHPIWEVIIPAIAVGVIAFAFRLPLLRNARNQIRQIVLRHQFFPVLPTEYEEAIIQQLLVDVKHRADASENGSLENAKQEDLCRHEARHLELVHDRLATELEGRQRFLKLFWLGSEWEMINCIYRNTQLHIANHPNSQSPALLYQLQLCQYYCFHLIARYVFATSWNREQALAKFAEFGFKVRLESKPHALMI